jgi:TolB protein
MRALVALLVLPALGLFTLLGLALPPLGRALPSSGSITYSSEINGDADLYTLDIDRGLRHNMTRHGSDDLGGVWSADGRQLAYIQRVWTSMAVSIWRLGAPETVGFRWEDRGLPRGLSWSPDGERLAYAEQRGDLDLFVFDVSQPFAADRNPLRLTDQPALDVQPVWTQDGEHLIFTSWMNGDGDIYRMRADGSDLVNLTAHLGDDAGPSLSPDGNWIAFFSLRTGQRELYVMDAHGGSLRQLTDYQNDDNGNYWFAPLWSPDGARLAITAVFEDDPEIVVVEAETGAAQRLTYIPNLDSAVAWLGSSAHLVFRSFLAGAPQLFLLDMQGNTRQLTFDGFPSFDASLWPPYP